MSKASHYLERWRQRSRAVRAVGNSIRDLRRGRPGPPPPEIGSLCERCGGLTEEIQCAFADYWLCSSCLAFFRGMAAWSSKVRLAKKPARAGTRAIAPLVGAELESP